MPSFASVGALRRALLGLGRWSAPLFLCASPSIATPPAAAAGVQTQSPPSSPAQPASSAHPLALADVFYPGFDARSEALPKAVDGGRVVVHVPGFPGSLNFMIENSSVTRRLWQELHEGLLRQDPRSFEYEPALAQSFEVLDQLVLEGGDIATGERVLVGRIGEEDGRWVVHSARNDGGQPLRVEKVPGQRLLRGTTFDFVLRQGVKWQDDVEFDARDVLFSMRCFRNPFVRCDEKRFQFDKVARFESSSPYTLRFSFAQPYFLALDTFESLTILPAHIYDLADPRNPKVNPKASAEEQGRFIEEHPANRLWIGLGPYKLAQWTDTAIVARRWDGYHDRAHSGHVDEIVWRMVVDSAAVTALLEGELDYFDRLTGDDYFGGRTDSDGFRERYYKGYSYGPQISYNAWNMRREKLKDERVRTALGMCFDWDGLIAGYYKGLARRVTGEQFVDGPVYDASITPLPFDPEGARKLLAEAGWYDRDQDGRVDKDGAPLAIEFLYQAGSRTSEISGQAYQANLKKIGVDLVLRGRDWAALTEALRARDFDLVAMGWITPPIVDPEQSWHSKWAGTGSANHSGLSDPEVDRLIGEIQLELDPTRQKTLFSALQRKVYSLQPYMFGVNVPRKFAMSLRVRNLESFVLDPGYRIRRWYLTATASRSK